MRANIGFAIGTGALALTLAGVASAQETTTAPEPESESAPTYIRSPVRAPRSAFELGVSTGYTQGFGELRGGAPIRDVARAGGGVSLLLGYRASPIVGVGLTGGYQQYRADSGQERGTMVRGTTVGVETSFHLAPFERVDPVLTLGTGYRLLWTAPPGRNNNTLTHGFELARLNAGLDIRLSDSVALGPSVGGGLNYFVWENPEGPRGDRTLPARRVNTFVFAGLAGRFDIGGERAAKLVQVGGR